jgi:DNA replication protein DnaD
MCGSAGCGGGLGTNEQKLSVVAHVIIVSWRMRIVLQVWPISTLMPLESKRRQNTINNRLKRKLLLQQRASTSSETELVRKQKKAEYDKKYDLKRKLQMQQRASTSSEKSKCTPSIFNDESTESFISLRRHIYMSHVNKVQPIRVK